MEKQRRSKKRSIVIAVLVGALVLVGGVFAWSFLNMKQASTPDIASLKFDSVANLKGAQNQLISGSVYTAQSENFYVDQTKGEVTEIKVAQGAAVRKGDELYRYSNPTLTTNREKALLQLDSTEARERGLETDVANLNNDLKKAPTTEAANEIRKQRTQVRQQLDAVRNEAKIAQLEIDELKDQIDKLTVRSNFDGTVEMVNEDEKNAVGQGTAAKPLIRVVSNLPYQIKGTVSELQRAQIKDGHPFTATSKALPGQSWTGKVTYVSTFPVTADAPQKDQVKQANVQYEFVAALDKQENLVPGNTLFLEINTRGSDGFEVPSSAIQRDAESAFVYVVRDGKLAKQKVTLGEATDGKTPITSQLDDKTEILLNPTSAVSEGTEVKR